MSDPVMRPIPARVYQATDVTCWAACLRSLLQTAGVRWDRSDEDFLRLMHAHMTSGGIDVVGLRAVGHVLNERGETSTGANLSRAHIRQGLVSDYLILGYVKPQTSPRAGHVVVIYGVNDNGVFVMNPDATGPDFLSFGYLAGSPTVTLFLPTAPLGAPANPFRGLTAP